MSAQAVGQERVADVVIIGAGLSGLIAARQVLRAGLEPLVVEASDRVGGRILSEQVAPGVVLELGAQWIGDTHTRMQSLAAEFGIGTYRQFEDGEATYEFDGPGSPVLREAEFTRAHGSAQRAVEQVLRRLDEMASTVSADQPWAAPNADEWDRITVAQWYDAQGLDGVGRELLEICTVGILAVPTSEVSLLGLLTNVATCGVGADLLSESEGGAQTMRFVGGTSRIPQALAASLGDRIVLDSPVTTLSYRDDDVTVTCRTGLQVRARRAIVALAPTLAGRIMYDPPLPGLRDQLTQRMPQASATKMFALYDEPFWRADGLSGQLISTVGPARMSNDSCMPPGESDAGILLGFLEGESSRVAARWSEQERRDAFVDELVRHFGPRAARPELVVEGGWVEREWTRGCYNANPGPCGWIHFGPALTAPIGPIHWAATETASQWSGYMEGAVEAGERAAAAVLASCSGT
ncbi:flavin monoamine oxidase family protein [Dermacoccaceae bacterium W4C1]